MNNIEALKAVVLHDQATIEFQGQTFTMKAPSLIECLDYTKRLTALYRADEKDAEEMLSLFLDGVELCFQHDPIERSDIERLVLLSGIHESPFIEKALILTGINSPVDHDEADADLPFGSAEQLDNH